MLAHEYKEDKHKEKVSGWWISEKYDGVCGLFKQSDRKMYSRNGKIYTLPDFITKQLISVGLDLHGEIWFGYDTFNIGSGLARRNEKEDSAWEDMKFMVFDTPITNLLFEDRIDLIKKSLLGKDLKNIQCVDYKIFDPSITTIAKELEIVEDKGGEGLVLRQPQTPYEFQRSHYMLKVKSWNFVEAKVIDYIEGTGKYKNKVGSLQVENEEFGIFKVGSGLNDWQRSSLDNDERIKLKNDKQMILQNNQHYKKLVQSIKNSTGKARQNYIKQLNADYSSMPVIDDIITIRYKEMTKDEKPRFPSFIIVRDYE